MDKTICKHMDWNFEPLDVRNMIELRTVVVLLHLFDESQTNLAISHNANRNIRKAERGIIASSVRHHSKIIPETI